MKKVSIFTALVLVTTAVSTANVQAADDLTKIKLSCNSNAVARTVGEALARNLRKSLRDNIGQTFSDDQSAQTKVKLKTTQKAPKINAEVTDYLSQGISITAPSLGGQPPEGENGVINFQVNASSVGSGAVLGRACSENYKFTVTASIRLTNQITGKRTRYSGSVTTSSTAVAGFYQFGK